MATYKINPTAVNPEWGGVVCLRLNPTMSNDYWDEILDILKDIQRNGIRYSLIIYDVQLQTVMYPIQIENINSRPEPINIIAITKIDIDKGMIAKVVYSFNLISKSYSRNLTFVNLVKKEDFDSLVDKVTELENKLNEITQTE